MIEVNFSIFMKCVRFILISVMIVLIMLPIINTIKLLYNGEKIWISILSLIGNLVGIGFVILPIAGVFILLYQFLCPYRYTVNNGVILQEKLFGRKYINVCEIYKIYQINERTLNGAYIIESKDSKMCLGNAYYDKNLKNFINELKNITELD